MLTSVAFYKDMCRRLTGTQRQIYVQDDTHIRTAMHLPTQYIETGHRPHKRPIRTHSGGGPQQQVVQGQLDGVGELRQGVVPDRRKRGLKCKGSCHQ